MSRDEAAGDPGRRPEDADIPFSGGGDGARDEAMERMAAWDANDPRRRDDPFAPPTEPCECYCLHCRRTFSSDGIWFQQVINDPAGCDGFWMCPTPNCDGKGFTFDIFPTDPAHPANAGWTYDDDDDEEEGDDPEDGEWDVTGDGDDEDTPEQEWDPAEPHYAAMDEMFGDADGDDGDYEGEEWKYGLQPGERPEPPWVSDARRQWEEEQKKYDQPDERPRVLDWKDREDRQPRPGGKPFTDDDIPF